MERTLSRAKVSTKQQRIAELAKQGPEMVFTTLAHHMDEDWLREAYCGTRKDGAVGVDGQTGEEYGADLEGNLRRLIDQAKSGHYRAPEVKRAYIAKEDGKQRPLGIPTFEDKVLQRGVVMLLEPIYEQDFKDSSYGFRPKRSAHQALAEVQKRLTLMGGGWVVEVDIEKYFDTIVHQHLREMLSQRVRDGVITRLIGKWLNAGVLEEGVLKKPEAGTPQGGVISPLLANIYLHEVVDVWFEKEVKPRMKGEAFLARYADDLVMGFANEEDARKVMEVLPKRFGKYGLSLHREKTRLVDFRSPGRMGQEMKGTGGSFDLLGFTHYWAKSRRGYWVVKQKTSKSRLARAEKKMNEWMRRNRHLAVKEQHAKLVQKLKGYCQYFGITGNSPCLRQYGKMVTELWKKWLGRRSQRGYLTWEKFKAMLKRYPLPAMKAVHSVYVK